MDNSVIPVRCTTNIDKFKREVWPNEMVCRPMVGDTVRSTSGKQLVIVQISHVPWAGGKAAPLEIELHTRDGSVPV